MTQFNSLELDDFLEEFASLEQKISELSSCNSLMEMKLEDANRLVKFQLSKEQSLTEERDSLLLTVNKLQQTVEEQCGLRVENDRVKDNMMELKKQSERTEQHRAAEVERLLSDMKEEEDRHQRELEAARQQWKQQVEDTRVEGFRQLEAKDAEMRKLLEEKDQDLEVMEKKLMEQERVRQSELLKLQMEFGAKLARVQNAAQSSEQQQHDSSLVPQGVLKRKLQFFQEEKNKEIAALRHRIKELEEAQRARGLNDSRATRRRT